MYDEHPHPLLAQVPLTVSPFLTLPTATPLPYTYKQLPSTLPPSILSSQPTSSQPTNHTDLHSQPPLPPPAYVTSQTGQTAHPDTILTSCLALQSHLQSLEANAKTTLRDWEERRRKADLDEKRRVAPGWLDGDVKILKPENVGGEGEGRDVDMGEGGEAVKGAPVDLMDGGGGRPAVDSREGEELDRAFGGMGIQ